MTEEEFNRKMSILFDEKRYDEIPTLKKEYQNFIWENEYLNKTREEKIKYWSISFNLQMRRSGEQGYDEMSVFTRKDFSYWKSKEPSLESLLPEILKEIGLSKGEIYPLLGLKL